MSFQNPRRGERQGGGKSWTRRCAALLLGIPLVVGVGAAPAFASPEPAVTPMADPQLPDPVFESGRYIVMLKEDPVVSYEGGTSGIPATKPTDGRSIDASSSAVGDYQSHLESTQRTVAESVDADVAVNYTVALNGFTTQLTAEQAAKLYQNPDVLAIAPDSELSMDYTSTEFVGLAGEDGAWQEQFGGTDKAGEGVVVADIDSGYSPENPYFAGDEVKPLTGKPEVGVPYLDSDGRIAMLKADGSTFKGDCEEGEEFDASLCNSKVLSARYFSDAFTENVPEEHRAPEEVISARDIGGHGSHTASTAAGNAGVDQVIGGQSFGEGSGMAPAAKLSIYKICWEDDDPDTGGCYTSSAVEAVDQAVLDGADVLNYSISGNNTSVVDPVALAFLNAADAGVFVSASAGNSGPTASTVAHSSPWVTTVAATTFPSDLIGTVETSDGAKYPGSAVLSGSLEPTDAVLAEDVALDGAAKANLCYADSLDPAKVAGKVVVCDRGDNARIDKSAEVKRAGGVGMVLVNLTDDTTSADIHSVPTVHLNTPYSTELRAAVKAGGLKIGIAKGNTSDEPFNDVNPQIAAFSSRGPSGAAGSDLLKPDISAPGVDVLAAVAPASYDGENFGFMSGTSMAAPHVTGYGALLLSKHPDWSPAEVKSALMTTSSDVLTADGKPDLDNFTTGAGFAQPADAFDPGVLFDSDTDDWYAFLEGQDVDTGSGLDPIAARDVNVPSVALGAFAGTTTVTREVTSTEAGTWNLSADVPGVKVGFAPSTLSFNRAGQTKTLKITLTNQSAEIGAWTQGGITLTNGERTASLPVALRPAEVGAPAFVTATGAGDDSLSYEVTSGTRQQIAVKPEGLSAAQSGSASLVPGALALGTNKSNKMVAVNVAQDADFAWFEVNSANDKADADMVVITPTGQMLQVATESASESGYLENPAAGTYFVIGNLYASPGGAATDVTVNGFSVGGQSEEVGDFTVSPDPLKLNPGKSTDLTGSWTGLESGDYFGEVTIGNKQPSTTMIRLTVNGESATASDAETAKATDLGPQLNQS